MVDQPDNPDINLISGEFWGRNPHTELAWMRANAPVYFDRNSGVWGCATHAGVMEAERMPKIFSNAAGIRADAPPQAMMIDMDDPEHRDRRKLVFKGFTPARVSAQEDHLRDLCNEIIDNVCEKGEIDFVWDIAAWLPLIVIADQLGVAPEDRATLLGWSDDLLRGLTGLDDEAVMARTAEAFGGYCEYAMRLADERRRQATDDLMSILVHAEVDGMRLDADSVIAESLLILIGGDETTRHVISGGLYQLLVERDRWEELRADRSLVPGAVEEMLRWVSPIKNMNRTVTEDVTFHGAELKAGDKLLLLYPSANRDESVFDDPFTFDIHRTDNDHVAFGGYGTHHCLGKSLARLELQVMFETLLDRLPDLELVDTAEPSYRPANFVSGYETLPVRFTPVPPTRLSERT